MGKNRFFLMALSALIGLFIFFEIMARFEVSQILSHYASFSFPLLGLYILVSLSIAAVLIFRWQYILKSHGHHIPFFDLFSYRMAGYSVGYLTPSAHIGGEPIRAYYLKKKHKVPLSMGLSTVLVDRALEFSGDALFAFVGFIILILTFALPESQTYFLLFAILAFLTTMFFFYYNAFRGRGFFSSMLRSFGLSRYPIVRKMIDFLLEMERNTTTFFRHKKKYFFISILFTTILWALMFIEYKVALLLIGIDADASTIFLVLSFVGLAYLIPIPAAIGALEAGQISLFSLLSIDKAKAIALSFLIRGRDLAWVLYGGAFMLLTRNHFFEDLRKIKARLVSKVKRGLSQVKWENIK